MGADEMSNFRVLRIRDKWTRERGQTIETAKEKGVNGIVLKWTALDRPRMPPKRSENAFRPKITRRLAVRFVFFLKLRPIIICKTQESRRFAVASCGGWAPAAGSSRRNG